MRVFFCLLMLMLLCPCAGLAQESALTARVRRPAHEHF